MTFWLTKNVNLPYFLSLESCEVNNLEEPAFRNIFLRHLDYRLSSNHFSYELGHKRGNLSGGEPYFPCETKLSSDRPIDFYTTSL